MKRVKMFFGVIVMTTSFAFAQETEIPKEMQTAIEKAAAERLEADKAAWETLQAEEQRKAALQAEMEEASTKAGNETLIEAAINYANLQKQIELQKQAESQINAEIEIASLTAGQEKELEDMILYAIQLKMQEAENQIKAQIDSEMQAAIAIEAQNRLADDMFNYYKLQSLLKQEIELEAQRQAAIAIEAQNRLVEDSINYVMEQYQIALQKAIEAQIAAEIQNAVDKLALERFAEDSARWAQYNQYEELKSEKVALESETSDLTVSLQVYPNPAIDYVNVEIISSNNFVENSSSEIVIVDITGKIVWKSNVINNAITIDLSSIHSGLYIIQYNGNSKNVIAKFKKE